MKTPQPTMVVSIDKSGLNATVCQGIFFPHDVSLINAGAKAEYYEYDYILKPIGVKWSSPTGI